MLLQGKDSICANCNSRNAGHDFLHGKKKEIRCYLLSNETLAVWSMKPMVEVILVAFTVSIFVIVLKRFDGKQGDL